MFLLWYHSLGYLRFEFFTLCLLKSVVPKWSFFVSCHTYLKFLQSSDIRDLFQITYFNLLCKLDISSWNLCGAHLGWSAYIKRTDFQLEGYILVFLKFFSGNIFCQRLVQNQYFGQTNLGSILAQIFINTLNLKVKFNPWVAQVTGLTWDDIWLKNL